MQRQRLTALQQHAMQLVAERKLSGQNINGVWRWFAPSEAGKEYTRQIVALDERKLVECGFYVGGKAGIWPSMAGSVIAGQIERGEY